MSALTKAEQSAVQKAEQYRGQAKDAVTIGDTARAGTYFQAAGDWYIALAKMIALRKPAKARVKA